MWGKEDSDYGTEQEHTYLCTLSCNSSTSLSWYNYVVDNVWMCCVFPYIENFATEIFSSTVGRSKSILETWCQLGVLASTNMGVIDRCDSFGDFLSGSHQHQGTFRDEWQRIWVGYRHCVSDGWYSLAHGMTREEHDDRFRQVLQRLSDIGLTLNSESVRRQLNT